MLSQTCRAAVKAVIYLASEAAGSRKSIADIAADTGENVHTLGKLLPRLVKAGLICSQKGPNGGFYVSEQQKTYPIEDTVVCIDGADVFRKCGLGLSECSACQPCPFHAAYEPIRRQFQELCKSHTVADLCAPLHEGLTWLVRATG